LSPSLSPSASPSESPSLSPSLSPSESPSESPSVSPSASPSVGGGVSFSPSFSPSPSAGWKGYSRGHYTNLPADDADLESYTEQDMLDVAAEDTAWVAQSATDQYAVHQYKDYVSLDSVTFTWVGQTTIAPSASPVVLEVYKYADPAGWVEKARKSDGAANVDFILTASISDMTDYKNPGGVVTCRVYQMATLG
jgi:hypothetical protein